MASSLTLTEFELEILIESLGKSIMAGISKIQRPVAYKLIKNLEKEIRDNYPKKAV